MKTVFAVIDTNVIVSAMLKWNSVPGAIVDLVVSRRIIPVFNDAILNEYREVLARPKFRFPKELVNSFISSLEEKGVNIDAPHLDIPIPDPKDIVFVEVTLEARKYVSAYLVTGNLKHFPVEPFVVSPKEMLDILLGSEPYDADMMQGTTC